MIGWLLGTRSVRIWQDRSGERSTSRRGYATITLPVQVESGYSSAVLCLPNERKTVELE